METERVNLTSMEDLLLTLENIFDQPVTLVSTVHTLLNCVHDILKNF